MSLNSIVDEIFASDRTTISVKGHFINGGPPGDSFEIVVNFPTGERRAPAVITGVIWTADFIDIPELKSWCNFQFAVTMSCIDAFGNVVSEPAPPLYLKCCSPELFFTVLDDQDNLVLDLSDACVNSEFVTVIAETELEWSPNVNLSIINPTIVKVNLPENGDLVTVTAALTNGCPPLTISVKRCCIRVPENYKLFVFDGEGNPVAENGCVRGNVARVVATAHEGQVDWIVNVPYNHEPGNPRAILVPLENDNQITVLAIVGRDSCQTPIKTSVKRCAGGPQDGPAQTERFLPRISWCTVLLWTAFGLLLLGTLMFTIGFDVLLTGKCFYLAAVAKAVPTGGLSILAAVGGYVFFAEVAIVGFIFMIVGPILLALWFYYCGGCDGIRSPVSVCEMLRNCRLGLVVLSVVVLGIECVISLIGVIAAGICSLEWLVPTLAAIPLAIDFGAIGIANFLIYWYANAIGCWNDWPAWLPLLRLPPPSELNLPCMDDDAGL